MKIEDMIDPTMSEKEREAVAALAEVGDGAPHRQIRSAVEKPGYKRDLLDLYRDEAIRNKNSPPYARVIKALEAL